jgi:hypothetical protein
MLKLLDESELTEVIEYIAEEESHIPILKESIKKFQLITIEETEIKEIKSHTVAEQRKTTQSTRKVKLPCNIDDWAIDTNSIEFTGETKPSRSNKVGTGSTCSVYRGLYHKENKDGSLTDYDVAVKILDEGIDLGENSLGIQWIVMYLNKNRHGYDINKFTSNKKPKFGYPAFISQGARNDAGNVTYCRYIWVDSNVSQLPTTGVNKSQADTWAEAKNYAPVGEGVTKDASYDIICIPYSKKKLRMRTRVDAITTFEPEEGLRLAMNLQYTMQDNMYDMQLVPYCPIGGLTYSHNDGDGYDYITVPSDFDNLVKTLQLDFEYTIKDGTLTNFKATPNTAILEPYALYASSKDRTLTKSFAYPYAVSSVEDKKVDSECRFVRICSPDGKGMWDYNVTKNGNKNTAYYIYLTFKPGQPYMHIRPQQFGGLYGEAFDDDYRGMMTNTGYSLSGIVDSWMQYIQQNNNYQEIFNRELKSLEIQHSKQSAAEWTGMAAGTITGAGAGAALGKSTIGGTGGMVGGGIVGGVASLAAGTVEVLMNDAIRKEQRELMKALHGLNLKQIKAQPDTLTKISNIDVDSHIVPYVEIYSASDDEITYLRNTLRYRGYTINRISTFDNVRLSALANNVDGAFISGRLIECPDLQEDAHMLNDIDNELMTGVRVFI